MTAHPQKPVHTSSTLKNVVLILASKVSKFVQTKRHPRSDMQYINSAKIRAQLAMRNKPKLRATGRIASRARYGARLARSPMTCRETLADTCPCPIPYETASMKAAANNCTTERTTTPNGRACASEGMGRSEE